MKAAGIGALCDKDSSFGSGTIALSFTEAPQFKVAP